MDAEKVEKVLEVLPDTSDLLYARYKDATDKQDVSDWYEHFLAVDNAIEIIRELKAENERLKTPTAGDNNIPLKW